MPSAEGTERTCIVVVQGQRGNSTVTMGIRVDEGSEVLQIAAEQIEAPPGPGGEGSMDFILALGKVRDKVVMLLDIDRVLGGEECLPATEPAFTE